MSTELYTVSEVAQYLRLSTKTVLRLISDSKLLASKVGDRSWRIKVSDIEAYLKSNTNSNSDSLSKEESCYD